MKKINDNMANIMLIVATWIVIIFMVSSLKGEAKETLRAEETPQPTEYVEEPAIDNPYVLDNNDEVSENPQINNVKENSVAVEPTITYEEAYSAISIDLAKNDKTIIIDPGHGNPDPGAYYNGVKESDINLGIGLKTAEYLEDMGYNVVLTRKEDEALDKSINVDLNKRCQIANNTKNALLFVSIHANANTVYSVKGAEVYYYGTSPIYGFSSKDASETIAKQLDDTGLYSSTTKCIQRGFHVLKYTQIPAVLIETGYISNKEEVEMLKSEENQCTIAKKIAVGIDKIVVSSGGS